MSALERCVHQILNPVWERCKDCAYDSENNKKCPNYSPTAYYASDNNPNLVSSVSKNFDEVKV